MMAQLRFFAAGASTALLIAASAAAQIQVESAEARIGTYRVTVTNATKGQVISPPLAVFHQRSIALFEVGEPVVDELAIIAEDGDPGPFADVLAGVPEVSGLGAAPGPVPPGQSVTWEVDARVGHRLSVVGMLVNTNDVCFAINSVQLPRSRFSSSTWTGNAYDAGSEANNEDCGFIPGPACQGAGAGVRDTAGAEGYVTVSNGIHGIADLSPAAYDWRNPTVRVHVVRIR